ncbi:MAG: hypothetical protein Q8L73_12345 [Methylotenera sp.]|nr:hypothetical protein [Methylotenera sp.]
MKSQLRFVMHSSDEREFAAQILSDVSVCLVDGPRWKTSTPETFRSLEEIAGSYCIIWSTQDRASLSAHYVPTCDDWYCESESATIQFLRSQIFGSVITEGRIAVSTSNSAAKEATGVEQRFKSLVRFIKKHYTNSTIYWSNPSLPFAPACPGRSANPSKPDAQLWVGPHALRWLQQDKSRSIKQFTNSLVEARLVEA